jgi:hypothetical protein
MTEDRTGQERLVPPGQHDPELIVRYKISHRTSSNTSPDGTRECLKPTLHLLGAIKGDHRPTKSPHCSSICVPCPKRRADQERIATV